MCETSHNFTIKDLKRFLYTSSINEKFNPLKTNANEIVDSLLNDGKGSDILKEIITYSNLNASINSTNVDATTYVLALIVRARKDENLTNAAYNALKDISETPLHLFAFIYYHKYLLDLEKTKPRTGAPNDRTIKYGRGWGKGQRKAVIKWYNGRSEEDILRLVTKYRHSHTWTNKDIIKMARIKPVSAGIELIFKYLLFGYEEIKNKKATENDKVLFEFITDYENLKNAQTADDAAVLIRKHKFHLEHLPTALQRHNKVWAALVEDMNIQQLCQYIGVLTSKELLSGGSPTEKFVLEKILTREQIILSKVHPIYPCLALQIYSQITLEKDVMLANIKEPNPNDTKFIKEALFNAFQLSASNTPNLSSIKRIMCSVCMNLPVIDFQTEGLKLLSPLQTATAIILTLMYTEKELSLAVVTDKINKLEIPSKEQNLDLDTVKKLLEKYPQKCDNLHELVITSAIDNKESYDAFIFLTLNLSDENENKLLNTFKDYRTKLNLPNAKLIIVYLQRKNDLTANDENLCLRFKGWNMESYSVLCSYLNDIF